MLSYSRPRLVPPIPPLARLGLVAIAAAALLYVTVFASDDRVAVDQTTRVEPVVVVPELDQSVLARAKDDTREHRLSIEPEPLRHLLRVAIDVGPTVAAALGMPESPVPVAEVRRRGDEYRGRWLWYEGVLEELAGPQEGHPVAGYSIYEATLKLADGERVICAFSVPPGPAIKRGSFVRAEGYLMKLRDTNYPHDIDRAPLLVGRHLQLDYEDWAPVLRFDPQLYADLVDDAYWLGSKAWHTIEEDQGVPLWHLAAYARDTAAQRSFADWRRVGTLNAPEVQPKLRDNRLERGTPMRVLGTLIRRSTFAADANPAGIKFWTVAWVQVRDYGGQVIPIWVPHRVRDLPLRAALEVRGFYYRWFAYEAEQGGRFRVPLFVAADLDLFQLETGSIRGIGAAIGALLVGVMVLLWWLQRRAGKESVQHAREMDERRRRRRQRLAPAPAPPPLP